MLRIGLLALTLVGGLYAQTPLHMYKSPSCGCCGLWGGHMEKNGFTLKETKTNNLYEVKIKAKVPLELASCHTAFVEGYIIEGHVPAEAVKELLAKKPEGIIGIAVPGMPLGSPGMEQGDVKDDYDVIAFDTKGNQTLFKSYRFSR